MLSCFLFFDLYKKRLLIAKLIKFFSFYILKTLSIKVKSNITKEDIDSAQVIASNHMSYLDIFILASYFDLNFITSYEMKESLGLGQLVSLSGCLYVERRNRGNRETELLDISNSLKKGLKIALFPEATTSDGLSILKYKKPMFAPAIKLGKKISLIMISYKTINGEAFSSKNNDKVCWYGDLGIINHFISLLSLKEVVVDLKILKNYIPNGEENLNELVNSFYQEVVSNYKI